ncbi:histidinol-phosphatase HisJ [Caldalkalibacillus mannanilyticus]|uniref:histidinol-phosphatase HisJ n=1 Tax=Caldalkalibacillus mannanilyticus TaxID=1418 RepID=UPI00046894CE|nr:histidinol-phosphatase HisJ [Caldalkalibacillus mannanilyticus]
MKWDGHTHTPYCPHGSIDPLKKYIEQAISQGFDCYSITEHAPLPKTFHDPVPLQDSAMKWEDLESYLNDCQKLKKEYEKDILIYTGFEVDFLEGYEKETTDFLNEVGPYVDDAILSVHFLPVKGTWTCVDYSPEHFEQDILAPLGSVDQVYLHYYQTYYKAVTAELGKYKPRRMGHLTVIEKFKKKYPSIQKDIWWSHILFILQEIERRGYQLDYNTAGLSKPLCQEVYPSADILVEAKKLRIPFVYGSDSHQAKTVGLHYDQFIKDCL